ncbi:Capsular polysaccharide type 8 biosynthesis protein cap8A [Planococcus massiliensis]|uniref:Capsular polysaccharide type 8 biosynthesis protein cap8A n=1 Tax=Planococcus massiliensis TaxID=1499687 RepID=A0A098EIH6_9BACL|nr:Wzz/FepE/Etk N-terminal domain-containing protein [Planococcus massiliensis]CEG22099.1 Capsular polysaccharide type 8 biosynthesis protein cap8A [Planococcus massiliensis]
MIEEINLRTVYGIIKKRILMIISLVILAAVLAGAATIYLVTPIYQTSTQILINSEQSETMPITNTDIQTNLQLINTYSVIIKTPFILDQVIERLGLTVTAEELTNKITVNSASESQVIDISVRDANAAEGVRIANMIATVFQAEIEELMNVDNVNILSTATLSENPEPVEPNLVMNIAAAAAGGLVLGIGIAFLLAFLDTTVKSEEDVEELLGLPILGVVSPMNDSHKVRKIEQISLKEKEAFRA